MPSRIAKITERDWIPRLRKCCCVYTLQTGSLVIAWTLTILTFTFGAFKAFAAPIILTFKDKKILEMKQMSDYLEQLKMLKNETDIPNPGLSLDPDLEMMTIRLQMAAMFIAVGLAFIVNVLLLVAIHKKTYCLMMPWLISKVFVLFASIYFAVKYSGMMFSSMDIFMIYSAFIAAIVLLFYFYLVIYSLFRDLKDLYNKKEDNFDQLKEEEP